MKQFAKVLASFSLAATMCLGVGFAADSPHPGEHGTVDKAMVSEETDKDCGTEKRIRRAPVLKCIGAFLYIRRLTANSPGTHKCHSCLRFCQFHSS